MLGWAAPRACTKPSLNERLCVLLLCLAVDFLQHFCVRRIIRAGTALEIVEGLRNRSPELEAQTVCTASARVVLFIFI